jgi:Domain of unknown function (DUF6362)
MDTPLVQQRLREAFAVELRLPDSDRPRGLASVWPASPVHEFRDMVNWPDVRERVWQSWARAKGGVFPHEISRMEEAQGWLSLVEEGERRCLAAWAARGIPVHKVLRQRGWAPTTFYRKLDARRTLPPSWPSAASRCADRVSRGRDSGRRSSPAAGGRSSGRKYF